MITLKEVLERLKKAGWYEACGDKNVIFGTKNHKVCMDCKYVRYNGQFNRTCVFKLDMHLWLSTPVHELDLNSGWGIQGTIADNCPEYECNIEKPKYKKDSADTAGWEELADKNREERFKDEELKKKTLDYEAQQKAKRNY